MSLYQILLKYYVELSFILFKKKLVAYKFDVLVLLLVLLCLILYVEKL